MFDKQEYLNKLKELISNEDFFEMLNEKLNEEKELKDIILFPKTNEELDLALALIKSIELKLKARSLAQNREIIVPFEDNSFVKFIKLTNAGDKSGIKSFLENTNEFTGRCIVDSEVFFSSLDSDVSVNNLLFIYRLKALRKKYEELTRFKGKDILEKTNYYEGVVKGMENRISDVKREKQEKVR